MTTRKLKDGDNVDLYVSGTGTGSSSGDPFIPAHTVTLPPGAATAAKQPALGTAGTASADVITVQGVASMTALKTDSSAIQQPVIANSALITGSTVTRPGDTNVYASGDLIANSTTAGSVIAISFTVARANDKPFTITKAGLTKSATSVTNAQFKLHLWNVLPTVTNGDNGVLSATKAGYLGAFDFDMSANAIFSDGARANGAASVGGSVIGTPATGTQLIYGLLEAKGAYTPANAETFIPSLEVIQD